MRSVVGASAMTAGVRVILRGFFKKKVGYPSIISTS